jgi:two-component system cell cycle response regulator DivK
MDYNFIDKTILIVEDDGDSRFFFENALRKSKANLIFVYDGIEAVEMFRENDCIDLVLMDVRLPRMDGIEATYKIKEINPEIPVIIQTAYSMHTTQDEAIKSGCSEFITKPIKIETLLSILQKYLIH